MTATHEGRKEFPKAILQRNWPNDTDALLLTRSATTQATTTGIGWGDTLTASLAVAQFLSYGPASIFGTLLSKGMQLQFTNKSGIVVPGVPSSAGNASFVQEGAPDSSQATKPRPWPDTGAAQVRRDHTIHAGIV